MIGRYGIGGGSVRKHCRLFQGRSVVRPKLEVIVSAGSPGPLQATEVFMSLPTPVPIL
jgi:hypothetical protein